MIPMIPRSGNFLEDNEDDRLQEEYENYGTESEEE